MATTTQTAAAAAAAAAGDDGGGGSAALRPGTLAVVTLNCWGLWLVSKRRQERMRHLARWLEGSPAARATDVVCLQEVWVEADAALLSAAGRRGGFAHAVHFASGPFGSGLVTLSRHPIVRSGFWRYAAAGYATALTCGDFYAHKGVGWARIAVPPPPPPEGAAGAAAAAAAAPVLEVDVLNTHLHANYAHAEREPPRALRCAAAAAAADAEARAGGADDAAAGAAAARAAGEAAGFERRNEWHGAGIPDDDDAAVRAAQVVELTELALLLQQQGGNQHHHQQQQQGGARPLILAGDLNAKPHLLEVDLLRARLPCLVDAWAAAPVTRPAPPGDLNPEGFTCRAPGNAFQPRRQRPERIDYVWCSSTGSSSSNGSSGTGSSSSGLTPLEAEVVLTAVPHEERGGSAARPLSYSDHYGVRAVLALPGGAAAAATAAAAAGKAGGGSGEGAAMTLQRRAAAACAALMLVEEGAAAFGSGGRLLAALGGFLLASLLYCGAAAPLLLEGFALSGPWLLPGLLAAGGGGLLGGALLLIGLVTDPSQRRALLAARRVLLEWARSADGGGLPRAAGEWRGA